MDKEFKSIFQELAFVQFESESIFIEDFVYAFEINENEFKIGRLCKDIVDNSFTARLRFPIDDVNIICVRNTDRLSYDLFRVVNSKDDKQVPLSMKVLHHASVKCWCIHRYEWHDFEGVLTIIRSEERKFLLVEDVGSYLMVTLLGVHGNDIYCVGSY